MSVFVAVKFMTAGRLRWIISTGYLTSCRSNRQCVHFMAISHLRRECVWPSWVWIGH